MPPGAAKAASLSALLSAPAKPPLPNGIRLELVWDASPDTNVIGYRLWNSGAGTNFQPAALLLQTNRTTNVVIGVAGGSTNTLWVTAHDGALDSPPSNPVRYVAPQPLAQSLTPASWNYQTTGFYGRTNRIQTSTDLVTWTTRLTFIGRGTVTNLVLTNKVKEFCRVIAG